MQEVSVAAAVDDSTLRWTGAGSGSTWCTDGHAELHVCGVITDDDALALVGAVAAVAVAVAAALAIVVTLR